MNSGKKLFGRMKSQGDVVNENNNDNDNNDNNDTATTTTATTTTMTARDLDQLDLSALAHRVELHEIIGRGGTATVHKGTLFGLAFAVKGEFVGRGHTRSNNSPPPPPPPTLSVCQFSNVCFEDRLAIEAEAKLMMTLQHPSLVRCFGFSMNEERGLVLLELFSCSYRDVLNERRAEADACKRSIAVPPQETVDVLLQVIRGVQHLHNQTPSIIHRDLKSENCFVQRSFG